MESLKLFFQLYVKPASTFSGILDRGNWLFAAMLVLLVGIIFYSGVNLKLDKTYRIPNVYEFYTDEDFEKEDTPATAAEARQRANFALSEANAKRPRVPVVGDYFFKFFSFDSSGFYYPLLSISIIYVPLVVLLITFVGGAGNFSVVLGRDYMALSTCTLMAWAAAHLPFGVAGIALGALGASDHVYLVFWFASGLLFGILMLFALRTVFGTDHFPNIVTVSTAWLAFTAGTYIFPHVSPWLFSPFLLIYGFLYFGSSIRAEAGSMGNAFRQRQNFKRFLHNSTVNPRDADAHIQLGLIYKQRRQNDLAREHFQKAYDIDADEIDANYELGKMARAGGEFQKALDHFAVVVEQNDKHSVSEIWREIGATYLEAAMPAEARDALEKFIERRSLDPEGLYYLGMALKGAGRLDEAKAKFEEAVEAARIVPHYQRREANQWRRLAQKEL